jgi:hypothetical protein
MSRQSGANLGAVYSAAKGRLEPDDHLVFAISYLHETGLH